MKISFGKPRKCLCVRLAKTFRVVPWIERGLPSELFFSFLFWRGYLYW